MFSVSYYNRLPLAKNFDEDSYTALTGVPQIFECCKVATMLLRCNGVTKDPVVVKFNLCVRADRSTTRFTVS